MGSRYLKDEDLRIPISRGDWLLVRKHLTAGDERDIQVHTVKSSIAGEKPELDLGQLGYSQAAGYLLDWSITDADDKPVVIRDRPYAEVVAKLRAQTPESVAEILEAIQAHDAAMRAERDFQKKITSGENVPSTT